MTLSAAPSGTRYEPIAQIGRGGMAEVQLAMAHTGGGVRRLAVLKRIWPELAHDPDFVTMFLDEARLSLRLSHPNVVQTYEVLTGNGELAIAMEYLDGQPLTKILNRLMRGPSELSLALRLRIAISVLAGLEHAHTLTDLDGTPLGVVHRDVSPQNVFVTYDGQVKLVDFGVAKTEAASHVTRPGTLKGKLAYMAPEQLQPGVEPGTIDRRADVFSVGVMLWEMLASRRMWQGMTEVDIVGYLASGRPMPELPADGNLPAGLDAICARAVHTDPAQRYQTAADLEIDLERVLIGSADSHARNLGKVVAMAFATERAERQALIERHSRAASPEAATASGHAIVATMPTSATTSGSIDISLAGLDPPSLADDSLLSAPLPALAPRTPWYRRVSTFAVATAGVLLAAGVARRPPALPERPVPPSAVAAPESDPMAKPAAAPALPAAPKQHHASRTTTATASSDDPSRARRRHRAAVPEDDDATLPPTWDERESE